MNKSDIEKCIVSAKESVINSHIKDDPTYLNVAIMELIKIIEIVCFEGKEVSIDSGKEFKEGPINE